MVPVPTRMMIGPTFQFTLTSEAMNCTSVYLESSNDPAIEVGESGRRTEKTLKIPGTYSQQNEQSYYSALIY